MYRKITSFFKDPYFRNSAIFFVGSLLVAVINYVYYPVLGRILSVEDFGTIQTIATIILQSTIILNAFGYVAIHMFSNIQDEEMATKKGKNLEGAAILITSLAILVAVIFSSQINKYLKFDTLIPLGAICLIFLLNVPFTIKNSWLQAKNKFINVSIGAAIAATSKLLFAVILIFLGFGVLGAVFGLVIATLLSLIYVSYRSGTGIKMRDHLGTNYFKTIAHDEQLKKDLVFGLIIFLTLISITFLYSADVVFIRRYFDATTAGYYSGIAAIARIIFFATFAFSAVMLPAIKLETAKENVKNLLKAIGVTVIIGGSGLAIFTLIPSLTISLLIGPKYLTASPLLPGVGLFVFLASITNVILVYLIALRKYFVAAIGTIGSATTLYLVLGHHDSVQAIIGDFVVANLITLMFSLTYLVYHKTKAKI